MFFVRIVVVFANTCHPCVSVCHPLKGCTPFIYRQCVSVSPFFRIFLSIQRLEGFVGLDGNLALVEHGAVETEDVDEEVIDGLTLVLFEVVTFVGQVDVAHLVLGIVETIDALQIREFEGRNGAGPVTTIRDDEHGLGSHDGSEFRFAGAASSKLNGFTALAGTTAIEVRG